MGTLTFPWRTCWLRGSAISLFSVSPRLRITVQARSVRPAIICAVSSRPQADGRCGLTTRVYSPSKGTFVLAQEKNILLPHLVSCPK